MIDISMFEFVLQAMTEWTQVSSVRPPDVLNLAIRASSTFFYAVSHYIIRIVMCLVSTMMESEEMRKCKCYIGYTEEVNKVERD